MGARCSLVAVACYVAFTVVIAMLDSSLCMYEYMGNSGVLRDCSNRMFVFLVVVDLTYTRAYHLFQRIHLPQVATALVEHVRFSLHHVVTGASTNVHIWFRIAIPFFIEQTVSDTHSQVKVLSSRRNCVLTGWTSHCTSRI